MANQYNPYTIQLLLNDLQDFRHPPALQASYDLIAKQLSGLMPGKLSPLNFMPVCFDIIPEVEKAAIALSPDPQETPVPFHLHFSPAPVVIHAELLLIRALLQKLLSRILSNSKGGSVINIHITGYEEKCVVESIQRGTVIHKEVTSDYFKKYRITNSLHSAVAPPEDLLPVYKNLVADMGGELIYALSKERDNYFRLKFPLA